MAQKSTQPVREGKPTEGMGLYGKDSLCGERKKHGGGRPRKYRASYCERAQFATGRGFTDKDLARLFGVNVGTITRWKKDFPEFCASLKKGKEIADDAVEKSLFQRATGYSHPDVHVGQFEGEAIITPIIKHYPPDPTAAIFWLKNRRPKDWREKSEVELNVHSLADIAAIMRGAGAHAGG